MSAATSPACVSSLDAAPRGVFEYPCTPRRASSKWITRPSRPRANRPVTDALSCRSNSIFTMAAIVPGAARPVHFPAEA